MAKKESATPEGGQRFWGKAQSFLSKAFWKATKTAVFAAVFGVGVNVFWELLTLDNVHDAFNLDMQAASLWVNDKFGWFENFAGIKGDGTGILGTDLVQNQLAPYKEQLAMGISDDFGANSQFVQNGDIGKTDGYFGYDDIMAMTNK